MTPLLTRVTVAEAETLPLPPGRFSALALEAPGLEARWYCPPNPDPQTPHERDEVYVVVRGTGQFERDGVRVPFGPGDLLFAAKGDTHRFVGHSPETAVWVVFGGKV